MALTYAQTTIYKEHGFGDAVVRYVVSNDYTKLFDVAVDGTIDVINADAVARDLNLANGAFAVDQLEFNISAAACISDEQKKFLSFCLAATGTERFRFCAVFMNPTSIANPAKIDVECLLFTGRLLPDVDSDDELWHGAEWSPDADPLSTYKFTAHSFDVTIFDSIKLPHLFVGWWADETLFGVGDPDVTPIDTAALDALFENRTGWLADDVFQLSSGGTQSMALAKFSSLGNMYLVLDLLMSKCEEILAAKLGVGTFTIDLIESPLGYETCPVVYEQRHSTSSGGTGGPVTYDHLDVNQVIVDPTQRVAVEISSDAAKGLQINKRMVVPVDDSEKAFSWHRNSNVSDLLFDIARSFGVYLKFSYIAGNHIECRFISRQSLVEAGQTYVRDVEKASRNVSSLASESSDTPIYEAREGNWAYDGADAFYLTSEGEFEPSQRVSTFPDTKSTGSRVKAQPRTERLLHSHSWPMMFVSTKDGPLLYDLNGRWRGTGRTYFIPQNTIFSLGGSESDAIANDNGLFNNYTKETLHTGVYCRFDRTHALDVTQCNQAATFHRPCAWIFTQINGIDTVFTTLSDYINALQGRDAEFYESEYDLDVPFWNGFSKNADGSAPGWSNLELGSRVFINETVQVLNESTNVWSSSLVSREYVVIGIKYDLKLPKTTIKMQRRSRFAFASFDGSDPSEVIYYAPPEAAVDGDVVVYEPGEDINAIDLVYVADDGLVYRAEADSEIYGRALGVALADAATGDLLRVQHTGRVISSTFTFTPGRPVYLRTNDTGSNISQDVLLEKNVREDLFARIGFADTARSFNLDIRRYILDT